MATADQIKNLVKAYSARDDEKFKTVVLQIAAHEAKLGHGGIAQELKKEIANIGKKPSIIRMNPNQSSMLDFTMPSVKLSELIASDVIIEKVNYSGEPVDISIEDIDFIKSIVFTVSDKDIYTINHPDVKEYFNEDFISAIEREYNK